MLEPERSSQTTSIRTHPFWNILRESGEYFLLVTLAAFALRLFFYIRFPHVTGDSLIYGDIAKNWLQHGIYGLTHAEGPRPTWIRLPGYPAFLALCFALFGSEHYNAVLLVQLAIDVVGCFVIADLARRTMSPRAARLAFLLAALCPLTANYTVAPLAETLSILFTAVALDCAVAAFQASEHGFTRSVGLDGLRRGRRGGNLAASRRWHSAGGAGAVSALADVAEACGTHSAFLGGSAVAGGFAGSPGAVDGAQLARLPPLPTVGPPLRQRSG